MYPSDYGYATSGGSPSNRTSCLNKELYNWDSSSYSDCKNNDWLLHSAYNQWTISPVANTSFDNDVFIVHVSGFVQRNDASDAYTIRPSVYLIPSTSILGGEGTPEDPYTIG